MAGKSRKAKLKTVIAEDETLARKLLRSSLEKISNIELVAECKNGREAVEATLEHEPDLLILDIQMPGMTGFEVVKALQADVMPLIVFCTAYQRYAVDAFDLHAVDYILKPVDAGRLERAVERAKLRIQPGKPNNDSKTTVVGAIDQISNRVSGRGEGTITDGPSFISTTNREKLAIKDGSQTVLVPLVDIDWVDAAGDYMCVHVQGQTHIMRSTMKDLMARLSPELFARIHRSTVVNLERIESVTPLAKGEFTIHLDCGAQLKVSRNYREAIRSYLAEL